MVNIEIKQNEWIEYTEENIIKSIDYHDSLYCCHWIHFEDGSIEKYVLVSNCIYQWMPQLHFMMIGSNWLSSDDYYTHQCHLDELKLYESKPTHFMKCPVEVIPKSPNNV